MKEAIEKLISACESALQVGEIRFESCALAADVGLKLREAIAFGQAALAAPPYVASELTPEDAAKLDLSKPGRLIYRGPTNIEIICKYTCPECGVNRAEVSVPVRPPDMDVVHWVQNVAAHYLAADHAMRSPACTCNTMSEMMIPISGAERIGGPSVS